MEEERSYKQEIVNTRKGCLGSSDAGMLARIANAGIVPKSCYKRLAVCKGLIPQEETPVNAAMLYGDFIENAIYDHLVAKDARYESNPMWVSKKLSRKNVRLIAHPDIVLWDDAKGTLFVYEVKTTKENVKDTKNLYKAQMFEEYTLGLELAKEKGYKVKMFLVHYDTNGLDDLTPTNAPFDVDRMTINEVRFTTQVFDVVKGMDIVDKFLEEMTEYYSGDEIDEVYLPQRIKDAFNTMALLVAEVKEREKKIDDFKERLYQFLQEKDIKSIKGEMFTITRIDPTVVTSVDYKMLFEKEIAAKTPYKARKMAARYKKETKKRGYVSIKEKTSKKES